MSARNILMAASGAGSKLYSDDVFSAYTYSGNSSTQTITNGIDLAGKGGLVWIKERSANGFDHNLFDTARGAGYYLNSALTGTSVLDATRLSAFVSNGFSLGSQQNCNYNTATYVGWTFRKAAKFFDVVTGTYPNGGATFNHSLGVAPGMYFIKTTGMADNWLVYHRSITGSYMVLNDTRAATAGAFLSATDTTFTLASGALTANSPFVAYLFAHDTATDGIIQCGSFTTSGGAASITLGWEPQYVLLKSSATAGTDWYVADTSRFLNSNPSDTTGKLLCPNTTAAETNYGVGVNATGFSVASFNASSTFVYMAVRRPNKPPTTGTQVYSAIARTGTGAAATVTGVGFAPDLLVTDPRATGDRPRWWDRLRGANQQIQSVNTNAESTATDAVNSFGMDGVGLGADATNLVNTSATTYINWFFKRAPGVFDEVCYTGTGAARTVSHSLGVAPELMIVKNRTAAGYFLVYHQTLGNLAWLILSLTNASNSGGGIHFWNDTTPTSSVFSLGTEADVNTNNQNFVAYLFATLAGVSKVGSYTGNGSSQTINCGFSAGARFVMVKRYDSTGDWYLWDTVRGIVSGNDPHLSLNTTAAEVTTDDSIDPDTSGFIVNQLAATNINVNTATYIYLAFA